MRAHPDVIAALAARGITDMSLVLIEVWTYGKALMPEKYRDRRLGWCDIWYRATPEGNPYAHPVSGLKVVVDMNTLELLEIENDHDHGQPEVNAEYVPGPWTGEQRTDLKPLNITQPEGVSFTVEGTELRWQNWRMRLGFNYREGPVIYQVAYDDHGTERDIAYRMSFAEMVVPYRDASFDHYRRTAFDIGEWGLGFMTTSLELGCDCLGEIVYLDAVLHDTHGRALHDQERDLPPRGGQRRPVEARRPQHRRRGPPDAPHGRVLPRDRRQLRVPRLLALLPGRQHRVRGTRDRADGHHAVRPREQARPRPGPSSTTARTRRSTSTSSSRASTSTSTATENTVHGGRLPGAARCPPRTPTGWPSSPRRPRSARRPSRPATSTGRPSELEGRQPGPHQRVRHEPRVQARADGVDPADDGAGHAAVPARTGHRAHALGHPPARRRALACGRLPDAVRARRRG